MGIVERAGNCRNGTSTRGTTTPWRDAIAVAPNTKSVSHCGHKTQSIACLQPFFLFVSFAGGSLMRMRRSDVPGAGRCTSLCNAGAAGARMHPEHDKPVELVDLRRGLGRRLQMPAPMLVRRSRKQHFFASNFCFLFEVRLLTN